MGKNRNQVIVRASVVGIVTNLLLAGFKAFVGMMSHSGYHDRRGNRPASAGSCR